MIPTPGTAAGIVKDVREPATPSTQSNAGQVFGEVTFKSQALLLTAGDSLGKLLLLPLQSLWLPPNFHQVRYPVQVHCSPR